MMLLGMASTEEKISSYGETKISEYLDNDEVMPVRNSKGVNRVAELFNKDDEQKYPPYVEVERDSLLRGQFPDKPSKSSRRYGLSTYSLKKSSMPTIVEESGPQRHPVVAAVAK